MASIVDISNTALSHIGDTANVSSINPPDGSAQASYCKTFYPIALNSLLEMAEWNFATRRAGLAAVDNPSSTWLYAYGVPSNMVKAFAVLPPDAIDDYSQNLEQGSIFGCQSNPSAANSYAPQPFAMETDADDNKIILTNVESAVLRYTVAVNDPMKFSPLFVLALSYLLASMLAGPIIKGDAGASKAMSMMQMFKVWEAMAEASDASQRKVEPKQSVVWMAGR